jgi:hypothetical protein
LPLCGTAGNSTPMTDPATTPQPAPLSNNAISLSTLARNPTSLGEISFRERVLRCYHTWGYGTSSIMATLLDCSRKKCLRYSLSLVEQGFLLDLGHARVKLDSPLRGRWFAPSRKSTEEFGFVPTHRMCPRRYEEGHLPDDVQDIPTNREYLVPRHHGWASRTAEWIVWLLQYRMRVQGIVTQAKHTSLTWAGLNLHLTQRQRSFLTNPAPSGTAQNLNFPDAHFFVGKAATSFRLEVDCHDSGKHVDLSVELSIAESTPILFVYTNDDTLGSISRRLPNSPDLQHILFDDSDGFENAMQVFGIQGKVIQTPKPVDEFGFPDDLHDPEFLETYRHRE